MAAAVVSRMSKVAVHQREPPRREGAASRRRKWPRVPDEPSRREGNGTKSKEDAPQGGYRRRPAIGNSHVSKTPALLVPQTGLATRQRDAVGTPAPRPHDWGLASSPAPPPTKARISNVISFP